NIQRLIKGEEKKLKVAKKFHSDD
ncbi:MAG: hypothetical protein XD81_1895, partial [Bacteroidetes bacterium 38_7]